MHLKEIAQSAVTRNSVYVVTAGSDLIRTIITYTVAASIVARLTAYIKHI